MAADNFAFAHFYSFKRNVKSNFAVLVLASSQEMALLFIVES